MNKKKLQSYCEVEERKPFNWNKFLRDAIANKVDKPQIRHAEDLAEDWVTCACGNQCAVIPRGIFGEPLDEALYTLGLNFNSEIYMKNWKSAKNTLKKIEQRSAKLIAKINKQKP